MSSRRSVRPDAHLTYLSHGRGVYDVFSRDGGHHLGMVCSDGPRRWFVHGRARIFAETRGGIAATFWPPEAAR